MILNKYETEKLQDLCSILSEEDIDGIKLQKAQNIVKMLLNRKPKLRVVWRYSIKGM